MGLYCSIRGLAYLPITGGPDSLPRGLELISKIITIEIWGTLWLAFGLFAIFSAITSYKTSLAWGFVVGIMIAWGSAFTIGAIEDFILNNESRDYLSATSYLLPGFVIGILSRNATLENTSVVLERGDRDVS